MEIHKYLDEKFGPTYDKADVAFEIEVNVYVDFQIDCGNTSVLEIEKAKEETWN